MELNDEIRAFIEKLGLMWERMGATRTAGRMVGLLLVANKPLSLNEMADLLHVSKASMSTNARMAEQVGMARRVSLPGDRRDYYEITPGSFEQMLSYRIRAIQEFVHLADDGLSALDEEDATARRRLERMKDFYQFFIGELEAALDHWRKHDVSGSG